MDNSNLIFPWPKDTTTPKSNDGDTASGHGVQQSQSSSSQPPPRGVFEFNNEVERRLSIDRGATVDNMSTTTTSTRIPGTKRADRALKVCDDILSDEGHTSPYYSDTAPYSDTPPSTTNYSPNDDIEVSSPGSDVGGGGDYTSDRNSLYPTFTSSGKFKDYKSHNLHNHRNNANNTNNEDDNFNDIASDAGIMQPNEYDSPIHNNKRKKNMIYIGITSVLLAVAIVLTVFLVAPSPSKDDRLNGSSGSPYDNNVYADQDKGPSKNNNDDDDYYEEEDDDDGATSSRFVHPKPSSTTNNNNGASSSDSSDNLNVETYIAISKHGYPYVQDVSVGWISWPQDYNSDNFLYYNSTDGVVDVITCAEKCGNEFADTGAWSVEYEACWCNFVEPEDLCKEPCVMEEYVEFSTVDFDEFDYCEESVCAKDWHHSQAYCDDDIKFDEDVCEKTIEAITSMSPDAADAFANAASDTPSEVVTPEDLDLSNYGYAYTQDVDVGWVSWPPDYEDDESSFKSFKAEDGVTSLAECAAKCEEVDAPTGAWSVYYQACWCNFVETANLCKEPCIKEEYVDFSRVSFDSLDYCTKSVCDESWYHSKWYCNVHQKFDKDACDVMISTKMYASDDTASDDTPPEVSPDDLDLKLHGYPYTQDVDVGWVSWPPDYDENDESSFDTFKAEDGVTSLLECAAKCEDVDAPTGAWSVKYQACWCNFVETANLCKEPCIEEEYIDFSRVSFDSLEYCTKSVCDESWKHSKWYCDVDEKFDKDACDAKIQDIEYQQQIDEGLASHEANKDEDDKEEDDKNEDETELNIWAPSDYGFRHVQNGTIGWLSWPKDNEDGSFEWFDEDDAVASLEECAAKCQELEAHAGAWSVRMEECWCNLGGVDTLCTEPCVEEHYVDFSTVPFTDFVPCEESVCDKDWFHSAEYCDVDVKFDEDECDAKIAEIKATMTTSTSPAQAEPEDDEIYIKPSALATIKQFTPDSTTGGMVHLSVEGGGERISFIRYEIPIADDVVVTEAKLNLYLTNHLKVGDGDDAEYTVQVVALPHAGKWAEGSVSFNNQLEERNKFDVNNFKVQKLDPNDRKQLYSVDVTSAFDARRTRITFELSTESNARLDFGGKTWSNGDSVPELVLTFTE